MENKKDERGQKGGETMVHKDVNPMAAGMMGIVAGAAVGVTATVALSNPKTRKKIGLVVGRLSKNATLMASQTVHEFGAKAVDLLQDEAKERSKPHARKKLKAIKRKLQAA